MFLFTFQAKSLDDAMAQAERLLNNEPGSDAALSNLRTHLEMFGELTAGDEFTVSMNGSTIYDGHNVHSTSNGCAVARLKNPNPEPPPLPEEPANPAP